MTAAPVFARQRASRELEGFRFSVDEGWGSSRATNYNERRGLQGLAELPRAVRMCGTCSKRSGGVELKRNRETGRVSYAGECYCKSITACAVCRSSQMGRWSEILLCHLEALRDRGGAECLLTFTIPHRRGDSLKTLHLVLRRAYRDTFSGAGWLGIAKRHGYLGSARVLETTWSPYAGHHPHIHALCFFERRPEDLGPFRVAVIARFSAALYKHAAREAFDMAPVDVDRVVSVQHANHAGQYITKIGLAEELTSPGSKVGRAIHGVYHLTMPQLARRLAFTRLRYGAAGPLDRERDRRRFASDKRVFLDYVGVMRGQQIFRLSPHLAERINALPLRPDVVPELSTMAGIPADEEPAEHDSLYYWLPDTHRKFIQLGPLARVEVERVAEDEAWPAEGVGWLIDRMVAGKWRPARDVLWGENADSPLFSDGGMDGYVRPLRGSGDDHRATGEGTPLDVLLGEMQGGRGARPGARGRTRAGGGDRDQFDLAILAGPPDAIRAG